MGGGPPIVYITKSVWGWHNTTTGLCLQDTAIKIQVFRASKWGVKLSTQPDSRSMTQHSGLNTQCWLLTRDGEVFWLMKCWAHSVMDTEEMTLLFILVPYLSSRYHHPIVSAGQPGKGKVSCRLITLKWFDKLKLCAVLSFPALRREVNRENRDPSANSYYAVCCSFNIRLETVDQNSVSILISSNHYNVCNVLKTPLSIMCKNYLYGTFQNKAFWLFAWCLSSALLKMRA